MTEYAIIISFLLSILVVGILFYFYRKWLIKNTDEDEVEKMTRKEILEKTIDFDDAINRIVRLEKENAELKEINTHTLSQLNLDNGELIIENEKLKNENTELKAENQRWKDEWQEQVQKATDEGYARTLQTIQLTKAKEIIKNLLSAYTTYADSFDDRDNEIVEEACQFISEVEK